MMKIYTRGGDKGLTSLANGERVPKADERVEAYGTLDELSAQIGMLAALCEATERPYLYQLQRHLFAVGSVLAGCQSPKYLPNAGTVQTIEQLIDELTEYTGGFKGFVLPGGALPAAQAEICRTVCRRAERRIYAVKNNELDANCLEFINRLSDFFFLYARKMNFCLKFDEIKY